MLAQIWRALLIEYLYLLKAQHQSTSLKKELLPPVIVCLILGTLDFNNAGLSSALFCPY